MVVSCVVGLGADPAGAKIGLQLPGGTAVERAFAGPAEAVRRDLGEAPARRDAAVGGALLHDVTAAGAAELARVELLQRVAPQDVPGVEAGVVDPECRAEEEARQDPDVLDGAALEHPGEMDLALAGVSRAVIGMHRGIEAPVADEPAIEP